MKFEDSMEIALAFGRLRSEIKWVQILPWTVDDRRNLLTKIREIEDLIIDHPIVEEKKDES